MSEVVAINYPSFNTRVRTNKEKVIKQLEQKVEDGKLDMLKASLKEKNIPFDETITDYYKLVDTLQNSLNGEELAIANKIVNNINREIDRMVKSLKDGSSNAFTKFLQSVNEKILTPVGTVVTNTLAMNTVMSLIPSIPIKAGISVILTGLSILNINKIDRYKIDTNRTYELDKILQELETTQDKDGQIIDTRFSDNDQSIIRSFLRTNNVIYEDTGYLSLREAIYSLDNEKKEELCLKLNMNQNQQERLNKLNDSLFTRLRKKFITPIAVAATSGVGIATSINSVDPTMLAAPLNGTLLGNIISKLTDSKVIGWISGIITGGLNFIGKFIPAIGGLVNKVSAIENIAVLAVAGAGVGLLGVIGKGIYDAIKNRKEIFNTQKNRKKIIEKDNLLYGEKDVEEINKMREVLRERSRKEESFIVNIVCQYMNELDINYDKVPKNIDELQQVINGLSNSDKNKVNKLFNDLADFLDREPNKFKRCMKKASKFIKTIVTVGLAGMSVTNILTSGGFFAFIKTKLFNSSNYLEPELITFDDSIGRSAYDKQYGNITEVKAPQTTTPPPRPQPGPAPATPTPTPTPSPTPAPTPGPSVTQPITAEPTIAPTYVCGRLPKLNYSLMDIALGKVVVNVDTLPDDELLSLIVNSPDYRFTRSAVESMPKDSFLRFKELLETSPKIDRSSLGYQWVKDSLSIRIGNENAAIKETVENYVAKENMEKLANKIGTGIGLGAAIIEEDKQIKTK